MTIWLWKIPPRLHLHPMTQSFEYEFTLESNDRKIFPRLQLHPMTQPFEHEFTLEPNDHMIMKNLYDHMIMKNLPKTSPATPDDSTIRKRVHLRTKWPYDYGKYPQDVTCTRWLNHSNTKSPYNQMTIWFWKISLGLHLHTMAQPFKYEFTLEPNDHMIMKNLPWNSPAPDDCSIRIRVHPRTNKPCDYEKSPRNFNCTRWLNHSDTRSP